MSAFPSGFEDWNSAEDAVYDAPPAALVADGEREALVDVLESHLGYADEGDRERAADAILATRRTPTSPATVEAAARVLHAQGCSDDQCDGRPWPVSRARALSAAFEGEVSER